MIPDHPTVLVIDVGGTHVKLLATGQRTPTRLDSGPTLTARQMVAAVRAATKSWSYDVISIGYPGPVLNGRATADPHNLGAGWAGFDFERAFKHPTHLINDAAMQALGGYRGGRMLFLGLGTGLGSALVVEGHLQPLELAHLPYRKERTFEDYLGDKYLQRRGAHQWRRYVVDVVARLTVAMQAQYVLIGGGNARHLARHRTKLPKGTILGGNADAFRGGMRLWKPAHQRIPRPARTR
jgi:polyphosphate glucokinase